MTEKKLTSTRRAVTINVTQPIIDRAEQRHSNHCMIADAIRVALPDVKAISVDMATIRYTDPVKRQRYVYLTPQRVQLALIRFDQGNRAEPFSLRLGTPVQVVGSGRKTTLPDGTKKRASEATQGVVQISGGTARPTKLGGKLPPKDELNVGGSGRMSKPIASAEKRAVAAAKAKELRATAPKARADALAAAEREAVDRAEGKPASEAANLLMEQSSRRHVREFGLKQLRP
jgi:hypothetical protein